MPAINALIVRDHFAQIAKRENWAQQEAGVIVVFCIVFVVAVGVISMWIFRKISARRAAKATF
jgi:flagellar basal body-associated protein FliL